MADGPALTSIFVQHAHGAHDMGEALESALSRCLAAGRDAWPQLELPAAAFVAQLARHCPASADLALALPSLHIEDLYLACACTQRVEAALTIFEQHHIGPISGFFSRSRVAPDLIDEVCQITRERLLVSTARPARIGEYSGRGSLQSWVRTVAMRTLLDLERQRKGAAVLHDGAALQALGADEDPELEFIKGRYRQAFQDALREALAGLPAEQRRLLHLHHVDGLNLEQVGTALGRSRATVYRWLLEARATARQRTRELLRQRLKLSDAEFASLAGVLRSRLDMTLSRALAAGERASP